MSPDTFNEQIWRMSPEYQQAYSEGFEAAVSVIRRFLKTLEPFVTSTGTVEFPELTINLAKKSE